MAEALNTAQRLRIPVFRLKDQNTFQLRHYARLTWDAELGGEITAYMGNRFYYMFCHNHIIACIISRVFTATALTVMWKKMGHQMELVRS